MPVDVLGLFPSPDFAGRNDDPAPVDMNMILKMEAMMGGIEHRKRQKAIGDGEQ